MTRLSYLALVLLVLTLPASARNGKLTLETCVELATTHAETNGLFDAHLKGAEADMAEAKSFFYPHLSVRPGGRYYFDDDHFDSELQGDLGHHFLQIPQNILRHKMATLNIRSAEHRRARARSLYRGDILRAYLACLRTQTAMDLAKRQRATAEAVHRGWQKIKGEESLTRDGRIEASNTFRKTDEAALQARVHQQQATAMLAALCGLDPTDIKTPEDLRGRGMPSVSLEACQRWAQAHRSDLISAGLDIDVMGKAVKLVILDRLPSPRLSFDYGRGSDQIGYYDDGEEGLFAYVALDITLWDAGLTRARARKLAVRRDLAKIELDGLLTKTTREVTEKYLALRSAAQNLAIARDDKRPATRVERARLQHKHGAIAAVELERAELEFAAHQLALREKAWATVAAEQALLEAIEANPAQLRDGLKMPEPGGDLGDHE